MPAIPLAGDRSAWNAQGYPLLHTNDTDTAASAIHHTLGTSASQAAPGDHTHAGGGGTEGPGIDITLSGSIGLGGDSFLVYSNNGNPVSEYNTIAAALSASGSGMVVVLPAGDFSESISIPAGVGVLGLSSKSIIRGTITLLGDDSYATDILVITTGNTSGSLVGIIGPQSGTANLFNVKIITTNQGSGNGFGIQIRDGDIIFKDGECSIQTVGGYAIGLYNTGAGNIYSHNGIYDIVSSSGSGYAFVASGLGSIYATSGYVEATTSPAGEI